MADAPRTLKEGEHYVRWLLEVRKEGPLTDIGRWQVYSLEAYALRVRADPEFIRRTQPLFANFLAGLTSPDEMQRKRFDDLAVVLGERMLDDVRVLLPLKRASKGSASGPWKPLVFSKCSSKRQPCSAE